MHHSSVSWEITLLYFFSWNFRLFWQKEHIKVPNFRLSTSPNVYLDRLLLMKVHKISDKKVQRSCVSWHWRLMQNLKKNWFVVSKLRRIWWILIQALKILKNLHFHWSIPWKVSFMKLEIDAKFEEKLTCGLENNMRNLANFQKYAKLMMQNLKRNWLVQNWPKEFNKFWPEHSDFSKICTLMGCFWPKYIML